MRIIEPSQLHYISPKKRRKSKRWPSYVLITLILIVSSLSVWSYLQPIPPLSATSLTINSGTQNVVLPWSKHGQAALAATGFGLLAQNGTAKAVPIASLAKIVVALAVLTKHPLAVGESGPTITITQKDEAIYDYYLAKNGSVVEVAAGEQVSLYQALEAMLLPSANNIADLLANWSFGSVKDYDIYANRLVRNLGLNQTHLADASGFSNDTVSTASDLVVLGQEALKNPVLAQIVKQKSVNISLIGRVDNTNHLLTHKDVIGIKTGNTDAAGGCYLFAAKHKIDGKDLTIIGAVLGAPTLGDAMANSLQLLNASYLGFGNIKVITDGQEVGYFSPKWGGIVPIIARSDLISWGWRGSSQTAVVNLKPQIEPLDKGTMVGSVNTGNSSVAAETSVAVGLPSLKWRLLRWL